MWGMEELGHTSDDFVLHFMSAAAGNGFKPLESVKKWTLPTSPSSTFIEIFSCSIL